MPGNYDVATHLLNLSGGRLLPEEPAGYATLAPPRKTARGREHDTLFLSLGLRSREPASATAGRYDPLLDLAAVTFYGTPGSVTSALRQAINAVNQKLLEANLAAAQTPGAAPIQGGLIAAVLRASDLYAVQCGPGLLLVAREAGHERFPQAATRPLGLSNTIEVVYFHTAIGPGEYFCFSNAPARGWSDIALVGLGSLEGLAAVGERLKETAGADTSALIGRFEQVGAAAPLPMAPNAPALKPAATASPAPATPPASAAAEPPEPPAEPAVVGEPRAAPRGAGLRDFLRLPRPARRARPAPEPAPDGNDEPETAQAGTEEAPAVVWGSPRAPASLASEAAPAPEADLPPFLQGTGPAVSPAPEVEAAGPVGVTPRRARAGGPGALDRAGGLVRRGLRSVGRAIGVTLAEAIRAIRTLLARMLPEGTLQREGLFAVPTSVQVGIAVLIPVLVVGVSVWFYLDRGRLEQYQESLSQAQWEVGRGRASPDALSARPHWASALDWLKQAEALRPNQPEVAVLRQEAQDRLDELDWVTRLDYKPLLPGGGLGRDAKIRQILVSGQDVYALEESQNRVLRLTPVPGSAGYTVDEGFHCAGSQPVRDVNVGTLIDIALIPGPTAIAGDTVLPAGSTVVLAFDSLGTLMYCAPGIDKPYASYLTPPDPGWVRPAALEMYTDRLYVMDPGNSEIWQYQASGGAFTQAPTRYFTSVAYDLSDVIDFAIAGGDVYLLRKDGRMAICSRSQPGAAPACSEQVQFTDNRPGRGPGSQLEGVNLPRQIVFDPPPEPSLFLLNGSDSALYQLSLRLDLVRQFRPYFDLYGPITAMAFDPAKRFYVAAGGNVYVAARP